MILPPSLLGAYQLMEYYTLFEQSAPRWNQHALQLFMERGHLGEACAPDAHLVPE
ncbi:hypothetical protein [Paenibacillus thiaminolyticus]|uniref:hypothetical protein n=1 Tax=Paenibacillus thiaminolyticus TaxID=49283 RepID=UPI0030B91DD4